MKLNLRYVIPVMCGTCIALTVSVAAAVSGTPEEDISYVAAGMETEALAFHAYDFTAPAAYSAIYSSETAEETSEAAESAESSETREVTTEPASEEESGDISEETSEGAASSMEVSIETDAVEIPEEYDAQSVESFAETDEQSAEAPEEAEGQPAEVIPEADKQSTEAPEETEEQPAPAETAAGYDDPQRQAMLEAVNAVRAEYGLSALSEMSELSDIAQQRARECANYFSHTRPNGTRWHTLLEEAGLKRNVRAENIAYYYPTAQQALNSWLNDPSHRANILNAQAKYIGIGYYHDGYNAYWVQIFLGE